MSDTTVQQQSLEMENAGVGAIGEELASLRLPSTSAAPVTPKPSYDLTFPSLPDVPTPSTTAPKVERPRIGSSKVTSLFRIPFEERVRDDNESFGGSLAQAKICADIMAKTTTDIEISKARDESMTFLVYGTVQGVKEARALIQERFQTQASKFINVPKEYHRFLLGKMGKNMKKIELETSTKISFPRADENSSKIVVTGTREGIDRAIHEIRLQADELSKQANVRLDIPHMFHVFIMGPHGERVSKLQSETNNGVRINIPPPSMRKDEISISGEKEAVNRIADMFRKEAADMARKFTSVSVEVKKAQHKYVIGPRGNTINEILAQTGVSIELPPLDSPSETVTLRGPQVALGTALSVVYEKANSVVRNEVPAPAWMHRHIIGKKGAGIQQVVADFPKVHVEFEGEIIILEGPPGEVDGVYEALSRTVEEMRRSMIMKEIKVEPAYHGHIIGKQGARVAKWTAETNVSINVPEKDSNIIRLEGPPDAVEKIAQEILDSVNKLKNEVELPVHIDHRFHGIVIGSKGESVREIRDKFNSVIISFPEPNSRSNIIHVRGNKADVQGCVRHLKSLGEDLAENNYQTTLPVFKEFNELIGEKRGELRKIREELGVRVNLPLKGAAQPTITINGKRPNVLKAVEELNKIQDELGSLVSDDLMIPQKFHEQLIGRNSMVLRSIESDCGGVHIKFPPIGTKSDKVAIRGPKANVELAKKTLLEMYQEREERSYTEEVKAAPAHHRYLIGKGGATINKLRDATRARFIFPDPDSNDRETIIIIGKKEHVLKAKAELMTLIKELDSVVELTMSVDPKYHRHFVARRGEVLREIGDQYGGVTVSFPRIDDRSSTVTLKGAKECVAKAKARIEEIVSDLEQTVHMTVVIPQKHHAGLMGFGGHKIKTLTAEYNVQVKFPEKRLRGPPPSQQDQTPAQQEQTPQQESNGEVAPPAENGDASAPEAEVDTGPAPQDCIKITGRSDNCEKAKEALLALVPVTEEVDVPFEYHRFIIGQKGKGVRDMMESFDVNISIPPPADESNMIKVTGTRVDVERAKEGLADRVKQLEDEKLDRAAKNFSVKVRVPAKFHPKLIGRRGQTVAELRDKFGVNIQIPGRSDTDQDMITVTGYEDKAHAAKADIEKMIETLESLTEKSVSIDARIHSRLIGARGKGIRSIMDEYKVDVKFPRNDDSDPNQVVVMGDPDSVEDCIDKLLCLEEEFLQDIQDDELLKQFTQPSKKENGTEKKVGQRGFVVTGAPWEAPSVENNGGEFPSLGGEGEGPPISVVATPLSAPAWGPRMRR